jgi:acetyltransferase-like isoleucine patch superfamily enzyme
MKERIIIYGHTQLAAIVAEYMEREGTREVIGFAQHERFIDNPNLYDRPVLPFEQLASNYPPVVFQLHVLLDFSDRYDLAHLQQACAEAKEQGYSLYSFIDQDAFVAKSAVVGDNCCLMRGVQVEPFAHIESSVLVRSGAHIGPGARVGAWSRIGMRALLTDHAKLSPESTIAASEIMREDG